jgi:hypothetical protein
LIQFGYLRALDSDMNESNHLDDEPRDLDLSSLTFDEFVAFFFAREIVPDDEQYDYFLTSLQGEKYFESIPSSPSILLTNLTKLFLEFGQIARGYTLAQVDQCVWGIWGANLSCTNFCSIHRFRWPPA